MTVATKAYRLSGLAALRLAFSFPPGDGRRALALRTARAYFGTVAHRARFGI